MQAVTRLPDLAFVLKHFTDLLGRRCTGVLTTTKLRTGSAERWHGAWYELDDKRIVGAMAVDLPLAAALGTSIALIPAAQAAAMVKAGALDTMATENLFECLNVSSRFFHRAYEHPVTIVGAVANPLPPGATAFPQEAKRILLQPGQRLDVALTIDGYGTGTIAIACT